MPKKICNTAGCNTLVAMKDRYCDDHKVVNKEDTRIKNKSYDTKHRNKIHDKFYHSSDWKNMRKAVLQSSGGLCVKCSENDMTVKADMVDHIIPILIDWELRLTRTNLQPLCYTCHNRKTGDDIKEYGGRV